MIKYSILFRSSYFPLCSLPILPMQIAWLWCDLFALSYKAMNDPKLHFGNRHNFFLKAIENRGIIFYILVYHHSSLYDIVIANFHSGNDRGPQAKIVIAANLHGSG